MEFPKGTNKNIGRRETKYEYSYFVSAQKSYPKWFSAPLIKQLGLSYNWHVVAGEESEEAETQKNREMRVLEAVYPRMSDIPHR